MAYTPIRLKSTFIAAFLPVQITDLTTLREKLFDKVALDKMNDAQTELFKAVHEILNDLIERLDSADKLRDRDMP